MLLQLVKPVHADCGAGTNFNLNDCFTLGIGGETVSSVYKEPATFVNLFANTIFIVAGLVIFGTFAYAAFKMIQDEAKGKDEARDMMTKAVTGLVVMFVAYWIVQIIGIVTGANLGFN
jgi:uncharacterized membrane protein